MIKTAEQIIDEIIMNSPLGRRLYEERLKRKYGSIDNVVRKNKRLDFPEPKQPKQLHFDF